MNSVVRREPSAASSTTRLDRLSASLTTMPQVVIARVNGFCYTGALELALACDLIVTADEAKFADTHAKWGLRPTWGMSQRLVRLVGIARARELSYTAQPISGTEAAAWGLATRSVPRDELDGAVAELAAVIADNSAGSIAAYKDLYRHALDSGLTAGLAYEAETQYRITDAASRVASFGKRSRTSLEASSPVRRNELVVRVDHHQLTAAVGHGAVDDDPAPRDQPGDLAPAEESHRQPPLIVGELHLQGGHVAPGLHGERPDPASHPGPLAGLQGGDRGGPADVAQHLGVDGLLLFVALGGRRPPARPSRPVADPAVRLRRRRGRWWR